MVERLFAKLAAERPTPSTELNYSSDFELLVAVVLSAQATDVAVNRATKRLFAAAGSAQEMVALGVDGIKPFIASIGLYNSKARHLIGLSERLLAEFDGQVPNQREALQSLPGVGRKTANVVLNVLFNQPTVAVDTHIFRVANRMGLAAGATPLAVERELLRVVPSQYLLHAHHWLILHGRYTCTARKPRCQHCTVYEECQWPEKG
ncbi:MAG: endonuclease III [Mariprofundales bacterium]|nr:endonuclease III [Mariprofundales bacterium]